LGADENVLPSEEVTVGWEKSYDEELHNFNCSANIIRCSYQGRWE